MRYVECGEIRTSALGFGCGSVMGRVGRKDSLRAMEAAWDAGVTLFDTARSYGYGEAEGLLGEFLDGKRERAVVVTKFGILPKPMTAWKKFAKPVVRGLLRVAPEIRDLVRKGIVGEMSAGHFDVATMRASLEESLRQMRTDYVDVLLVHEAPEDVYRQDDLMAELEKVVREGKARRTGVASTGRGAALAAARGPEVLSVVQYPAMGISDWQRGAPKEHMRLANHPLGGPVLAKRVGRAFRAMAGDRRIDAGLREKLDGDAAELVAAFWFARAEICSRPDSLVTSMLDLKHLRANVAAIERQRFSPEDVQTLQREVTMLGLLR